jgi:D-xylose transport system substrate-binding protein
MIIVTDFFEIYLSNYKFRGMNRAEKKIVIGLSFPTQREESWVVREKAIEAAAKEAGVKLIVKLADTDALQQDLQIEGLISQNVDVLIIGPVDAILAAESVKKAHRAGIKVIAYERLILNTDLDLYVSFDNEEAGELQGKYLTDAVPKGNYILMSGDPGDYNSKFFKEAAMKFIQPLVDKGDIKIIADGAVDNWLPINAYKIVEKGLITSNNDVQGILAPNDGTAGASIVALTRRGLAGKVAVTGLDAELFAAQRIVQGTQLMTVLQESRVLGKQAIEQAIKMAKGEKIDATTTVNNGKMDVPAILSAPNIAIDKNNIDRVLIQSGYLNKEDVYGK